MKTVNQTMNVNAGVQYLSQVLNALPDNCIFDKGRVGAGGTHIALTEECNTVIAVPFVSLIENKVAQFNGQVFGMYGGVTYKELKAYLADDSIKYKKIMVTYDSLDKILPSIEAPEWKIMIDEYHLLFTQYSFRRDAVQTVLDNYKQFKSFCFLTATVLEDDFILEELKDVQVVRAVWEEVREVFVESVRCEVDVVATTAKTIQEHLSGEIEGNAYIFVNSIEFIKDLIKACNLTDDNTRVIYSKNNKTQLTISRGATMDKPKKINLLTSTVFEGADLYDENGRTYIVSDNKKQHTLTDISTSFQQIAGRIRNTKYWNQLTHIFSVTRYSNDLTYDEFKKTCDNTKDQAATIVKECNGLSEMVKKNVNVECESYVVKTDNIFSFDANLLKIDLYNFKVTKCLYAIRVNVDKALTENGFTVNRVVSDLRFEDVIKKETKATFEEVIEDIKDRSEDEVEYQEALERFSFLAEAIEKLGFDKMKELNYHQSNIKRALISMLPVSQASKVAKMLKQDDKFGNGQFVPAKYAKEKINKFYQEVGIKKAANIRDFYEVKEQTKKIEGKAVAGHIIVMPKLVLG